MSQSEVEQMDADRDHVNLHLLWGIPDDPIEAIRFLAFGLAGEAGELTGPLKKQWRGDDLDPAALRIEVLKELADVGNYAFMLARKLGVSLPDIMVAKFREVEQRPKFLDAMRKLAAERDDGGVFKFMLRSRFGIDLDNTEGT